MPDRKAVEADHAPAAAGKPMCGRASHGAEPDDRDVVCGHADASPKSM